MVAMLHAARDMVGAGLPVAETKASAMLSLRRVTLPSGVRPITPSRRRL
ncbi:hypothetical protein [Anaeromyxobacter paludicola]|nr:hypothetical protein [Anaeromyxobacter paludicola]